MTAKTEINRTTKVVREAMRIVSSEVRSPKVVRDGTVQTPTRVKIKK